MPKTKVVYFRKADGTVPALEWLDGLSRPAIVKCRVKLERLSELGHELRRPEADYLRDGIYEVRVRLKKINYRMLYFFHSSIAAVVSHGILKEKEVPAKEIDEAIKRKEEFLRNPKLHTHEES